MRTRRSIISGTVVVLALIAALAVALPKIIAASREGRVAELKARCARFEMFDQCGDE